jgi:hypothetical protein
MTLAAVALLALAVAIVLAVTLPSSTPPAAAAGPHGAAPSIIAGPAGRAALNGPWVFKRDPKDTGLRRGWARGSFEGTGVRLPYVPDAAKLRGAAGVRNHNGSIGWYRTKLTVPEAGRYAIRFESVNHRATVFLDGRKVAQHKGTYLPFEAREDLQPGREYDLVVRADWRGPLRMKRDGWHRTWFNFGGINREVSVRRLGSSELLAPTLRTRLRPGGEALLNLTVHTRNLSENRELAVKGTLERPGRKVQFEFPAATIARDGVKVLKTRVRIPNAELWAPGSPNLWELKLEVPGESTYVQRVGLRELRTEGHKLLLNGERVILKGASMHEDVLGRGDGLHPADQDQIIRDLQSIGANATRSQHPVHPALLERLDAAGILLWQGIGPIDAPGAWTSRGERRLRVAKDRVRETFKQAQMHPSIITWNLVNEIAGGGHPAGQIPFIDSMAAELKRRDPGRPVALDIWGSHPPREPSRVYRNIDMIGWTNYIGWYEATHAPQRDIEQRIRRRLGELRSVFPDKVIAVTEFGAEGNGLNRRDEPGGFDFQADLLGLHVGTYASIGHLSGSLVWNLRDFAVAPSFAGGSIRREVPDIKLVGGVNQKGLLDEAGGRKPAADRVTEIYAGRAAAAAGG